MHRSLPPLGPPTSTAVDDPRAPSPLPPLGYDISRPSSTSTQSSTFRGPPAFGGHHGQQQPGQQLGPGSGVGPGGPGQGSTGVSLPGLSALASVAAGGPPPPQARLFSGVGGPVVAGGYPAASPTPTSVGGQGNNPPVCQNCQTTTTPLWRRDELGAVLCNACGLFLKLHGRPRPISLKTDVIKSRNRVKSGAPAGGPAGKKPYTANGVVVHHGPHHHSHHQQHQQQHHPQQGPHPGAPVPTSDASTPPPPHHPYHFHAGPGPVAAGATGGGGGRRVSQHRSEGGARSERSLSPLSRAGTPHSAPAHHPHHYQRAPGHHGAPPFPPLPTSAANAAYGHGGFEPAHTSPLAEHHHHQQASASAASGQHLPPPPQHHLAAPVPRPGAAPHLLRHSPSLPALHLRHPSPAPSARSPAPALPPIPPQHQHQHQQQQLSPHQQEQQEQQKQQQQQQQSSAAAGTADTLGGLRRANATLRTQVSELELVTGLYQGRVAELERAADRARGVEEALRARLDALERQARGEHGHEERPAARAESAGRGKRRHEEDDDAERQDGEGSEPERRVSDGPKRTRLSDMSTESERSAAGAEARKDSAVVA